MKTIIGTQTDVIKELTAQVADVLARKPEANIAVSAVDLPAEVLGALAASDIAFDKATLFQACEYCGAAGKGAHAVGAAFSPLTAAKPFAAVYAPDPDADAEHAADYDAAIQAAGGLDLVILGLGERGHVAFNEPGAGFGEKTHIAKLAEVTREAIAADFGALAQTPGARHHDRHPHDPGREKDPARRLWRALREGSCRHAHGPPGDVYPRVVPAAAHGCRGLS